MPNLYDITYAAALAIGSPLWAIRRATRAKVRDALSTRRGRLAPRAGNAPAVMIHAVSVGELNAARGLIEQLQSARPGLHLIVTTTTTTGIARAQELFGNNPSITLSRFPIDLSGSINRFLDNVRPSVVVLMELEVWPNWMAQCTRRNIPVVLANGRITEPSFKRYRLGGGLTRRMFSRLKLAMVQEDQYADRFERLGVRRENIVVTGTMKFDSAMLADSVDGTATMAQELGIDPARPLLVCGSTGPGEEAILLDAYQQLLNDHPTLDLAIIPRHPPRFNEVAQLIHDRHFACVRRSKNETIAGLHRAQRPAVLLGDTMGELRKFYALATLVFVGRSLVDLGPKQHGSDMIEPAGAGKAVICGPFTGNFAEPVRALLAGGAMIQVGAAAELARTIDALLRDRTRLADIGTRGREVVRLGQGATQKHCQAILTLLGP